MPSKDQEYLKTLPFQPGMVIAGKYKVQRLVAAGGMGAVLQAHHEVLDQTVAIKLMRPEIAENIEAAQRFLREARAAARIESDYVARVTDVDMWEDTPFMVMEFLKGGDLDDLIDSDTTITVSDAVDYVMQGLGGLHAAHALGVVHRDLKPSNLFLVERANGRKRVKILDFGISKVVGDDSEGLKAGATTSTQAMLGTPRYMSPEQVSSAKDVDVRTDIWAMGLILYELLTKTYPFEGDSAGAILAAILTSPVPPARELRRDVPIELDEVVSKFLSKKRDRRYPTAKSAMKALAPFASRRIQSALLDQEELEGALAVTETHGTPSEVLSSARTEAISKVQDLALAATAISGADFGDESPSTKLATREGPTQTSMSIAGVKKGGGGTKLVIGALAAAAVFGIGFYVMQGNTPAETAPAAKVPAPDPAPPASSPASEPTIATATHPPAEPSTSATPSASASAEPEEKAAQPKVQPPVSPAAPRAPVGVRPPPTKPKPPTPKKPKDLLNDWD